MYRMNTHECLTRECYKHVSSVPIDLYFEPSIVGPCAMSDVQFICDVMDLRTWQQNRTARLQEWMGLFCTYADHVALYHQGDVSIRKSNVNEKQEIEKKNKIVAPQDNSLSTLPLKEHGKPIKDQPIRTATTRPRRMHILAVDRRRALFCALKSPFLSSRCSPSIL